jgi:hypothetical protein
MDGTKDQHVEWDKPSSKQPSIIRLYPYENLGGSGKGEGTEKWKGSKYITYIYKQHNETHWTQLKKVEGGRGVKGIY